MATNYSIADQQSHPQWELDFIQMMHRLEAIRNQIHWSDNILLSLRTVNLHYLLNHMPTGYQQSREPQHVLFARFLEVIEDISTQQSILFQNQNTSSRHRFNINQDCCDEDDFDSDDAMFTASNEVQFIAPNAFKKADILFFLHQIGLYSMFDAGYQCTELSENISDYPRLANLSCYNKIPNKFKPTTYNHCPLCQTYSIFSRKFGIQDIIKTQHSCTQRNTGNLIDYNNICSRKKGFRKNYEMYQHFTSKSNSCPMHLLLLKYLEQFYQSPCIQFQKKIRKEKSFFKNVLFNSKQQSFNIFKLTR